MNETSSNDEAKYIIERRQRRRVVMIALPAMAGLLMVLWSMGVGDEFFYRRSLFPKELFLSLAVGLLGISGLTVVMTYLQTGFKRSAEVEFETIRYQREREDSRATERVELVKLTDALRAELQHARDEIESAKSRASKMDAGDRSELVADLKAQLSAEANSAILSDIKAQVAAGYVTYGSSTMLVYTTGKGVNGFTLDPSIGEFCLSHPDMMIPKTGTIYSINEGNYVHFPQGVKKYIKYCQEEDDATKRPYTTRYIGSLVSDFHRNMIKGGIYIYPSTGKSPKGKLRLIYECNPLAMIVEQAGGKASNGYQRILDLQPTSLHQRTPFFIGSSEMVAKAEEMMKQFAEI